MDTTFDDIRAYRDEELMSTLARLTQSDRFWQAVLSVYPNENRESLTSRLNGLNGIEDFQVRMVFPIMHMIEQRLTSGIRAFGLDRIDEGPHVFISNHRDIILDSALLDKCLVENGRHTVEIAIGNNLLIEPWIEDLVRLNRSFIVRRGGGMREVLTNSMHLSAYIHHTITENQHSCWIAQREGRAKDSDDRTQDSVIKMLGLAGHGDFAHHLAELHICPLAITYEYDPCDYLKARELQLKRDYPDWHKTTADDMTSMSVGVMGYKGHVTYHFTPCIDQAVIQLSEQTTDKHLLAQQVAHLIDRQIFAAYAIHPINMIAYDQLTGQHRFAAQYTEQDRQQVEQYFNRQLGRIDLPDKDEAFLRTCLLKMYANPLRNQLGE